MKGFIKVVGLLVGLGLAVTGLAMQTIEQVPPMSYAGWGLVVLGMLLMVTEAFVPSFGALGFGGIVAFIVGLALLGATLPLILGMILVCAVTFLIVTNLALRARTRPLVNGPETLLGATGVVITDLNPQGQVKVAGEIWVAVADVPLSAGTVVKITAIEGLQLTVKAMH